MAALPQVAAVSGAPYDQSFTTFPWSAEDYQPYESILYLLVFFTMMAIAYRRRLAITNASVVTMNSMIMAIQSCRKAIADWTWTRQCPIEAAYEYVRKKSLNPTTGMTIHTFLSTCLQLVAFGGGQLNAYNSKCDSFGDLKSRQHSSNYQSNMLHRTVTYKRIYI